jgi:hypothetical protein
MSRAVSDGRRRVAQMGSGYVMRWILFTGYHPCENRPGEESVGRKLKAANQSSYCPLMTNDMFSPVRIATVLFPLLNADHLPAGLSAECRVDTHKQCAMKVNL